MRRYVRGVNRRIPAQRDSRFEVSCGSPGVVLVFDAQQRLRHPLGDATANKSRGSVTCLAVDRFAGHVAGGFESGCIVVWDIIDRHETSVLTNVYQGLEPRAVRLHYVDSDTLVSLGGGHGTAHVHTWRRSVVASRLHTEQLLDDDTIAQDIAPIAALNPRGICCTCLAMLSTNC